MAGNGRSWKFSGGDCNYGLSAVLSRAQRQRSPVLREVTRRASGAWRVGAQGGEGREGIPRGAQPGGGRGTGL